jgi:ubiquinone/menaquinone biosynthesis C-methylase UbiE
MKTKDKKGYKGAGMNGRVARWYARTRRHDLADFRRSAAAAARDLPGPADVLEIAPGPGFFAVELAKLGPYRVTGLDISPTFVALARDYARQEGAAVDFREGNASALPFPDGSFDFVTCSAAFKNFAEPLRALDEMHRVLRPGGQALVADLRKDVSVADLDRYLKESGRTRFDAWVTRWVFRCMLIRRAYTRDAFERLARRSRFGGCRFDLGGIGFEARFRKEVPAPAALPGRTGG